MISYGYIDAINFFVTVTSNVVTSSFPQISLRFVNKTFVLLNLFAGLNRLSMNPELLTPHELQTEEREVKRWYLAYTKPRLEQLALVNLQQQGFEAYLPLYKKIKSTKDSLVEIFEPMFPRYVLFRPGQPQQSISTVNHTKGVSNIVRFGFEPASLSNDVVVLIRKLETERNQASNHELSQLKSGQKVLLKHTALKGMEGIIQSVSSKRVAVLLEILGRPTLVKVEHHQIQVTN